jgi:hypothetical protein
LEHALPENKIMERFAAMLRSTIRDQIVPGAVLSGVDLIETISTKHTGDVITLHTMSIADQST